MGGTETRIAPVLVVYPFRTGGPCPSWVILTHLSLLKRPEKKDVGKFFLESRALVKITRPAILALRMY